MPQGKGTYGSKRGRPKVIGNIETHEEMLRRVTHQRKEGGWETGRQEASKSKNET